MPDITKLVIPEIISGPGARRLAARSLANLGARKVLVVTDAGVTAAGWAAEAVASLADAGLACTVFSDVSQNPRVEEAEAGAARYASEGCNAVLAVGGGSPIDCAKGVAILATNGGTITDYEGVDRVASPVPPLVCVATTAGSAADVSQFAILTDRASATKLAIVSKMIVPDLAVVDPLPLTTMPAALTAATGLDTLCHAVEAYVSTAASPLTDLLALEAARLVLAHLPAAIARPHDLEQRAAMQRACLLAGAAFSNASLGAVHAMAHAAGGLTDATHGECNAVLLPWVVAYNFAAAPARHRALAGAMGMDLTDLSDARAAAALSDRLRAFALEVGAPAGLRALGVAAADAPDLARRAVEDLCMATNPRCPTEPEIRDLYEAAL